jgi:osmotically-inducible protein OsmY
MLNPQLRRKAMDGSEEAIRLDVIDQLKWDTRVDTSNIEVEVSGGTVKLTGTVSSFHTREIAGMDALNVKGVNYLENDLTVQHGTRVPILTDEQIKSNIEKLISWDPDVATEMISVAVESGTVIIEGTVTVLWKKLKTEDLVSNMNGVVDIINKLVVVPTETYIDQAISEEIVAALERNLRDEITGINIQVKDQVVTLSGKVPNWGIYHSVRDAARYAPGVKDVHNNLVVAPSQDELQK